MNMVIKSGGADILKSGIVSSFGNNPINFTFLVNKTKLILNISAKIDQEVDGQEVHKLPNKNNLDIIFVNPQLTPYVRTSIPEELGYINDRKIYCTLKLEVIGTPSEIFYFTVAYTFYLDCSVNPDEESIEVELD